MKIPTKHNICHYSHVAMHCTYLGMVFFQASYAYSYAAGILGVIVIVNEVIDHTTSK